MKIKVTIERDCCARDDLVILGTGETRAIGHDYWFCKFCGRHWTTESIADGSGYNSTVMKKLPWPWEDE